MKAVFSVLSFIFHWPIKICNLVQLNFRLSRARQNLNYCNFQLSSFSTPFSNSRLRKFNNIVWLPKKCRHKVQINKNVTSPISRTLQLINYDKSLVSNLGIRAVRTENVNRVCMFAHMYAFIWYQACWSLEHSKIEFHFKRSKNGIA